MTSVIKNVYQNGGTDDPYVPQNDTKNYVARYHVVPWAFPILQSTLFANKATMASVPELPKERTYNSMPHQQWQDSMEVAYQNRQIVTQPVYIDPFGSIPDDARPLGV